MAPDNRSHNEIDTELRQLVHTLYMIITQVTSHEGAATTNALQRELPILIQKIASILRLTPHLNVQIPPDVIEYVQEGRNPDIYTREFVELAMRNNQRLRGKMDAFAKFRDVLAREVAGAVPALRADVEKVVVHTGGDVAALDRDAGVQIKVEEG